jgi:hypothetical protein
MLRNTVSPPTDDIAHCAPLMLRDFSHSRESIPFFQSAVTMRDADDKRQEGHRVLEALINKVGSNVKPMKDWSRYAAENAQKRLANASAAAYRVNEQPNSRDRSSQQPKIVIWPARCSIPVDPTPPRGKRAE